VFVAASRQSQVQQPPSLRVFPAQQNGKRHRACLDSRHRGGVCMFALSAILIGVIGVFYVRRRSSRKKQQA
jgi:hypothetical protein